MTAVDIVPEKVDKINRRISPIQDEYITRYLAEKPLDLTATLDGAEAYRNADFVVIAAPTNYDPVANYFYRVVATTYDSKADAVNSRDALRSQYADAWILYNK